MSMDAINETVAVAEAVEMDPETVYAKIIKEEDGYHVVDFDGTVGPVCKLCDEGNKTIVLTPNASNRKWFSVAKAEQEIAEKGYVELYYKGTKKIGSGSTRIPNEKLISYLPQELQDEYKAIIARAIEAKNADKKKPVTEREKLMARIEKAKAALAALEAEASGEPVEG